MEQIIKHIHKYNLKYVVNDNTCITRVHFLDPCYSSNVSTILHTPVKCKI